MWRAARTLLAVMVVMSSLTAAVSAADDAPNAAETTEFTVTGTRCELDVLASWVDRAGTLHQRIRQIGFTESSIPLFTGELTTLSVIEIDATGVGSTAGTFVLDPVFSTGTISGSFSGTVGPGPTESVIDINGIGSGALRGVSVEMTAVTPGEPPAVSPCDTDLVFNGTGTVSYPDPVAPPGMVITESGFDFATTLDNLVGALDANPNIGIVATVDHAAAAASRDLALLPTTEVFFGNPALGTPLMLASQTTGIDLPQKMLIWEDLFGNVFVGYNAPSYLQSRHRITGADDQLATIGGALAALAEAATGMEVDGTAPGRVGALAGLVFVESAHSVDDTVAALLATLESIEPINVAFTLDHAANGSDFGLRPTSLIVFGNPSLGTPLMQTGRTVAIDLPQKFLVFEAADGSVSIAYNDPGYVAGRHGLRVDPGLIQTISGALAGIAEGAAG